MLFLDHGQPADSMAASLKASQRRPTIEAALLLLHNCFSFIFNITWRGRTVYRVETREKNTTTQDRE